MKQFKVIILTGILFLLTRQITTAQNQQYLLDTLSEFEVIDPQIYQALDTILFYTKDCIFSILNRPYYLKIFLSGTTKKTFVRIQTTPYHWPNLNVFRKEANKRRKGFFYYKDHLVLVEDRSENKKKAIYPLFFKKTDSVQVLYYTPAPRYPTREKGIETASIYYRYKNGNLEEERKDVYREYPHYVYQIKKNDTWESIANELKCTVEELQNVQGVHESELPAVGTNILFRYYRIENGRMRVERTR